MKTPSQSSLAAFLLVGGVLAGCVVAPPEPPEDAVRQRAQQWLDALMHFDIEGIYRFTSPAYRSAHSARFYAKNYAGRNMWKTAELGDVQCDAAHAFGLCKVEVVVTYRGFNMKDEMTTVLTESWIEVAGVWYSQPRQ